MAVLMSGLLYEHREVVLRNKPLAMLASSPKGTVPVLVLADGAVIDESIDIMHWALRQRDPEGWLERCDSALVAEFDEVFKHHLDRYKYAGRYDADPLQHRAAGLAMLEGWLEVRLAGRAYLDGTVRGFDDIALFPFVRQFAGADAAWFAGAAPPLVQGWLARLVASELFARAMVKVVPWDQIRAEQ